MNLPANPRDLFTAKPNPVVPHFLGTLKRLPDWSPRLIRYLEDCKKKVFEWDPAISGGINCVMYAAGCVEALTGCNPYHLLAQTVAYNSAQTAMSLLRDSFSAPTLEAFYDQFFSERDLVNIQVGDILLVDVGGGSDSDQATATAVAFAPHAWALAPDIGLKDVGVLAAVKAYNPFTFVIPEKYFALVRT